MPDETRSLTKPNGEQTAITPVFTPHRAHKASVDRTAALPRTQSAPQLTALTSASKEESRQKAIAQALTRGAQKTLATSPPKPGKPAQLDAPSAAKEEQLKIIKAAFFNHLKAYNNWGFPLPDEADVKDSAEFNIGNNDKDSPIGCNVKYVKEEAIFSLLAIDPQSVTIFEQTIAAYLKAYNEQVKNNPLVFELTVQSEQEAEDCLERFKSIAGLNITKVSITPPNGQNIEWQEEDIQAFYEALNPAQKSASPSL